MSKVFPACHGIGIAPASLGLELGWLLKHPPLEVEVELVDAVDRASDAKLAWELEMSPVPWLPAVTGQTWEEPGDRVWVGNTVDLSLRVDHHRKTISVAAKDGYLLYILEALASVALPLVAQQSGSLVLHGCAASCGGSALLVCAQGGSGKSSLLMGLVSAGWDALSEDQCVIDLAPDGRHRVWPGPSWARLRRDAVVAPLLGGREPRFEAVYKQAWDLRERVAHSPATLNRIVLLEPPGGNDLLWEPLTEADVIGALARHATWFQRAEAFAPTVLPALVKLGMSVPGFRMRLPRRPDWLEQGVALLTER